jgi:DNA polymerase-1
MKKELYILDVSGYIFRAYYALPPMTNAAGESTQALYGFIRSLLKLIKDRSPTHLVAVFDGPDNKQSRLELYEKYKAHRTEKLADLPEQLIRAKEFCDAAGIAHIEVGGVEADDTMGSIAKWASSQGYTIYLCTSDKDLCQLVDDKIFILNTWKDNLVIDATKVQELYGVPPSKIVDFLALTGDTSDNIPGIQGIGPKTAVKLLEEFGSLDYLLAHPEEIKGKKQQSFIDERETALLSRRLATIHLDVDFPKDEQVFSLQPPNLQQLKVLYSTMNFTTLIKELDKELPSAEKGNYSLINDQQGFDSLMSVLSKEKEICFTTETAISSPILAEIVGIAFCIKEEEAFYVPFNGALDKGYILEKLKQLFENKKLSFYGHNVKYDCHVLNTYNIEVAHLSFDTILASYLLDSAARSHSLDTILLEQYSRVKTNIKDLIGTGKQEISRFDVALEKMTDYCCETVDYSLRLKKVFLKRLQEEHLLSLFENIEMPLIHVLMRMERAGVGIDPDVLATMSSYVADELQGISKEIFELAGEEFNISSPKQLSHILFEKLGYKPVKKGTSHYSTNAEVLEMLAEDHLIAQKILAHRQLEKLKNTYLDTLPKMIHPETRRIHPTFIQFGTATGRLACQDPNLQNIPVRSSLGKKIRSAFIPQQPSWSYLAADYSQIELRLLAHLSGDSALVKAFNAHEDIHSYTASLVFGTPLEKVTPTMRHQAKAINFGIIYGQGPYGLSKELGIDIEDAKEFIQAYFERYPGVYEYVHSQISFARKHQYAITMFKRKRLIPEINSNNQQIQKASERLAVNMPLQGSAADIIKLAMIRIDSLLRERNMKSFMVLQIHDELIFEAPETELSELEHLVRESMEGVIELKIPLIVDVSIGKNWGEC